MHVSIFCQCFGLACYSTCVIPYSDIDKIRDGTGYKLGMLVQYLSTFTASIIVALISEWRLTLLLLILAPFLTVTAYFITKVICQCI